LLLIGVAAPAWASQTPRYEPAPAWVLPAPPIRQGAGLPVFAVLDQQTRISRGEVWSYRELGTRAISADALARMGTITLNWQPFHGDLIIHRIDIVRDGQRIDVLKTGQKFNVIRREQGLERLEMNGVLTATMQVEGLRVGDVLDIAYSESVKDPALSGGVQANAMAMAEPFKVDFARARMLWPTGAKIQWKGYPAGLKAAEKDAGGWHEVNFTLPAPKPPDMPADAPKRYQPIPAIEASSFADWPAVSAVFAPLYRTEGLITPGSLLAQEVDKIRARESSPRRRAASALSLVQDRIRYFADGMNGGNYTPQSPERTWAAGYGDCKAKTLLLLALLHALDIQAEPILASVGQGDLVAVRLPSPEAFNHIFVRAQLGGEDLWLDGTGRGAREEDLDDPPAFHSVLPVRDGGAQLLQLPTKAPARPTRTTTIDIDQSAALALGAPFTATVVLHGAAADALRGVVSQLDNEKLLALADASLGGAAGPNAIAATQKFDFDPDAGTVTISVSGIARPGWRRQDHAYRLRLPGALAGVNLNADRARPAWKDIPLSLGDPSHWVVITHLRLPDGGRGVTLEGDGDADLDLAGRRYVRKATLTGDLLTIEERSTGVGGELPAAELPATRAKLAAAQGRTLRLATGPDYAPPYEQIQAAVRAHKLDRLAALYATVIAVKPDDPARYLSRAMFYEGSFQRDLALADLDKAVSLDGNETALLARAGLWEDMGRKDKAAADLQAVLGLDPSSKVALTELGLLQIDAGRKDEALAPIDEHLANADEDKPDWEAAKSQLLARAGDADGAISAIDRAIAVKSASADFLNARCWIKGTLAVQLDSALQDCTRATELTDDNVAVLDSRAMVYFRLNRLSEALADLDAALDRNPVLSSSLYLRAVIERRMGKAESADRDAASARLISPRIDEDYGRWKIKA
jgi:tetratricopeptide (TPR) repeat protein/transglutaminase-like putative cysteine protease